MGIRLFARPTRFAQCRRGSIVHTRVLGSYVEIQKNAEELGETGGRKQMNAAVPRRCPPSCSEQSCQPHTARDLDTFARRPKCSRLRPCNWIPGICRAEFTGTRKLRIGNRNPELASAVPTVLQRHIGHTFAILQAAQISSSFFRALSKSKSSIDEARDFSRSPSTVPDRASVTT